MMGRMVEMDDRMDAKGYLRLTTYAQTMRLLGNTIDDEVKASGCPRWVSAPPPRSRAKKPKRAWILVNRWCASFPRRSFTDFITNCIRRIAHEW